MEYSVTNVNGDEQCWTAKRGWCHWCHLASRTRSERHYSNTSIPHSQPSSRAECAPFIWARYRLRRTPRSTFARSHVANCGKETTPVTAPISHANEIAPYHTMPCSLTHLSRKHDARWRRRISPDSSELTRRGRLRLALAPHPVRAGLASSHPHQDGDSELLRTPTAKLSTGCRRWNARHVARLRDRPPRLSGLSAAYRLRESGAWLTSGASGRLTLETRSWD